MGWFGIESDREILARFNREQKETNQRLHDAFREESSRRCDEELAERWRLQEIDSERDDRMIQAHLESICATEQLERMKELGKYK